MNALEKFQRFAAKYPHSHLTYFNRPHWTRRRFFQIASAGISGAFLAHKARAAETTTAPGVTLQNKAKNVIFVLLTGAPSHTDTFDLKVLNGTTPSQFNPTMLNGVNWPMGLLPKLGGQLGNVAIVRSVQAWALVHSLAQTWSQIGRNPVAALGDIAPNIGSVVAIEKDPERQPGQVFPTFLSLNSPSGIGNGYFPATVAPFHVNEAMTSNPAGLPDTSNVFGQPRLQTMLSRLHQIDDPLRLNSPYGQPLQDYNDFYSAANGLTYNPTVAATFSFSTADSMRYGNTTFGNACLIAKQVLAANQGTRFIQISLGNWDMHQDIYGQQNPKGNNLFTLAPVFDNGFGALLSDLKASGQLDSTLIVVTGEFGRTVGPVTAAGGRDHWKQQSILFAGAGIKGKVLGTTTADGSDTADFGWSANRYVKPEDIEATIYSALGIDYTTVRHDDPLGRGFEYVPFASQGVYQPIDELWS